MKAYTCTLMEMKTSDSEHVRLFTNMAKSHELPVEILHKKLTSFMSPIVVPAKSVISTYRKSLSFVSGLYLALFLT